MKGVKGMKSVKKLVIAALCFVMAFAFVGCGAPAASDAEGSGDSLKIGIIQYAEHPALSASRDGFVQALVDNGYVEGENITLDIQVGSNDVNNLTTIADQLIANESDLILAIATPAAQSVAGKTSTIPILGTAITDYVVAGLADSNEAPGRNISGTTDMNPINEQIDLLLQLVPEAKTVGFVYSSNEDNSRLQVALAKEYLDGKGIAYKEVTIANSNDVQQAVTSLVGQVDALYLPTDNVIASTMPMVSSVAGPAKLPTICGEQGMVESGGLATVGISYYDLGYQTGLMAVDILKNGTDVSTMPIQASTNFEHYINGTVVEELGISVPADLQQYVK